MCAAFSRFVLANRCAWAPCTECGIKEAAEVARTTPWLDLSAAMLPGTKMSPSARMGNCSGPDDVYLGPCAGVSGGLTGKGHIAQLNGDLNACTSN